MGETGLTAELARFIAAAPDIAIPPEALNAAKRAFIDTVGVVLAGRHDPAVAIVGTLLPDGTEASALHGERLLSARDAALLNGLAGHVMDYDDVGPHGHPSVVLVPAILAEAQRLDASGHDTLRAYVIGYETWSELASREPDAYHLGSWHPTPMLGIIAATAAVASLNRLEETRARHALAIAASLASGVIANFGSHTKPLHAGRASAGAIEAVQLASAGFTGSADAIESPHGLMHGISPRGQVDTDKPARLPGKQWRLLEQGLSVKRYPVCYASHRAIDGAIDLASKTKLNANDVKFVTVGLGRSPAATLRYPHPRNGFEAKFSLHHNIAAALMDGAVGFAQLTDDYVARPDVVRLFDKTRMEILNEECPEQPGLALHDRVVIETNDGRRLDSGPIRRARGHAAVPLSDNELDVKFLDCARHGGATDGAEFLDRLRHMEDAAHVRDLPI